jgi:hypothetical protein
MITRPLHNIIYAIALFSLTGVAAAESADSDVNPLYNEQFNQQKTQIPTEYILSEMYTVVNAKSSSEKTGTESPVQIRKSNGKTNSDNFDWIPVEWYSTY